MRRGFPRLLEGHTKWDFLQEIPEPKRHRSRKDTRRWCAGHPGREHIPYWENTYWEWYGTRDSHPGYREITISQIQVCWVCHKRYLRSRSTTYHITKGVWEIVRHRRG